MFSRTERMRYIYLLGFDYVDVDRLGDVAAACPRPSEPRYSSFSLSTPEISDTRLFEIFDVRSKGAFRALFFFEGLLASIRGTFIDWICPQRVLRLLWHPPILLPTPPIFRQRLNNPTRQL